MNPYMAELCLGKFYERLLSFKPATARPELKQVKTRPESQRETSEYFDRKHLVPR